ncbi:hypothetical protein SAY87_027469 [Trapa incisa]|uniref:Uncharacterized protein n=1 Tax=Trapa incisa TaxID=236973 RepID=A0AAN7GND3_9MYRT|nr:hypothetical protein SAY87_027469 [Trapa incisa]
MQEAARRAPKEAPTFARPMVVARGKNCLCAAHNRMAQEEEIDPAGLIGPGLFQGLVSATSTSLDNNPSSFQSISIAFDCMPERPAKKRQLIPPQVLVPFSMKSSSSFSTTFHSRENPKEGFLFLHN